MFRAVILLASRPLLRIALAHKNQAATIERPVQLAKMRLQRILPGFYERAHLARG